MLSADQGRGRRLLKFAYLDHPPKSDVTSGLNCAAQLVSQSKKNGVSIGEVFPLFANHQVRVLSY